MRAFLLIATAAVALAVVGLASATPPPPPEGVHGAAIRDFSVFGFEGKWTVAVNATRVPSGEVVGKMNVFVSGTPLIEFGYVQATPTYLEIDGDTACVVGEITKLMGWYDEPILTVFKVVDVPGGPDMFGMANGYAPSDPAYLCGIMGTTMAFTSGNFSIVP